MKSQEEKIKQQELKKAFKKQQEDAFLASLPMPVSDFIELFNELDEKLGENSCDDSLRFTEQFLIKRKLPVDEIVSWLNENGGYCDCEALSIEEKFENISE